MKKDFPVYDICTLSEFKQDDILISRFAPYLDTHKNLYLPHKHNFYHLVLFTEGSGSHAIDFHTFKVNPFQIYFMIPGQVHSWAFKGSVDGYVINFSVSFFQSLLLKPDYLDQFPFFSGLAEQGVIEVPAELHDYFTNLFEQIIAENETPQRMAIDMVKALMLQVFITTGRLCLDNQPQHVTPYNYTLLRNFQKLIEQNFTHLKLPKNYAELLYITPNHLNALCNDVMGMPAGEMIRNRIALEAKRLLVNMSLTIAEIADKLNFADNSYFTKFFKKQAGLTPEEFRKKALNNI
ncbi:AraC family transcriptional regulator [Mucilaginibacter sp. KACC 22063]|uniref:AraC family transcriptional regulator n=1 Tax=Mucilaginibacter sp. KACC 22063 TaxID=3025666 RepID=UPI002366B001|nr:helix-turn-helix transcriptional regulator [Mucilaginibacter sp. KACC 22063]WDF54578.1 helix-turn-helix transcriptional regulator [Mucilaginibacter sp. KACC 22063]